MFTCPSTTSYRHFTLTVDDIPTPTLPTSPFVLVLQSSPAAALLCHSIRKSINQSINQSTNQPTYLSISGSSFAPLILNMSSSPAPSPSPAYARYSSHRNSQSFDPNTPPAPPPKPSSQEVSRRNTPAGTQPWPPPPHPQQQETFGTSGGTPKDQQSMQQARFPEGAHAQQQLQDPGEQWLPKILEDKSSVTLLVCIFRM